jgi:hypothetical protein
MKTAIIMHVMPHEIDWFEWQAKQLKQCAHLLESNDLIILDVTLNLNKIDWSLSKLPKDFFIKKFNYILETYFDWCYNIIKDINDDNTCRGCADKRRSSVRNLDVNYIIYLDCDLIFSIDTLKLLLKTANQIQSEYFIISPQIPKLWDSSWHVLMNDSYKDFIWDNKTFIDPFTVNTTMYGEYILTSINTFKLGGGWFNLFSSNLLKLIDIPDSLGSYGPDDTFIMYGCDIMEMKNYNVQQYIIKNLVVSENHKYRKNIYSDFLIDNSTSREEDRTISEQYIDLEIQKLLNKF